MSAVLCLDATVEHVHAGYKVYTMYEGVQRWVSATVRLLQCDLAVERRCRNGFLLEMGHHNVSLL